MNSPLISVIVPVYNSERSLEYSIKSLIEQTFDNIQIILVNDGSTDNSLELCRQLAEKDSRILVIDKKNGGVSSARNAGLDKSDGEYITFLDADDYACPTMLEHMYNEILKNNADIVHMNFITQPSAKRDFSVGHITGKAEVLDSHQAVKWLLTKKSGSGTAVWSSLFKSSVIGGLRFPEGMDIAEDKFFMLLSFLNSNRIVFDSGKEYIYLVSDSSAIHSKYSKKNTSSIILATETKRIIDGKYPQFKEYAAVNLYKVYILNMTGISQLEKGDREMQQLAAELKRTLKQPAPKNFAQYTTKKERFELKLIKTGVPLYKAYIKCKGLAGKLIKG